MTSNKTDRRNIACLHRKRRTLSQRLGACKELVKGSLIVNRRRCGKPRCRCQEGQLHESYAFTFKKSGRSVLIHVPKWLEAEARQAQRDYRKLRALVDELSAVNVALLRNKARRSKTRRR